MKAKGDVVEQLVAWLHDWPGVAVRRNVRLPTANDPNKAREIDVLLETTVAGYPIRIAIECKNEKGLIGAPKIDAFVGKLDDVGLPSQCGVFVSASGFTGGALRRARKSSIRALVLKGLSPDGLKAKLAITARQAIVFLCLVVEEITYFTVASMPSRSDLMFQDASGNLAQTIPHLLAQEWTSGGIPGEIGVHEIHLRVPADLVPVFVTLGKRVELATPEIHARVRVVALAHLVEGNGASFQLADPETSVAEKMGFRVTFPALGKDVPLTTIVDKTQLGSLIPDATIILRTFCKVPRIVYNTAYWPLSLRAATRLAALSTASMEAPSEAVRFLDIEEANIRTAWEPGMTVKELDEFLRSVVVAGEPAPAETPD